MNGNYENKSPDWKSIDPNATVKIMPLNLLKSGTANKDGRTFQWNLWKMVVNDQECTGFPPVGWMHEEFEKAMPYFKKKNLKKGEYFINQGKVCSQIAFINKGSLKTFYLNHKSEEVTSCFCGEHCFVTSYKSFIKQKKTFCKYI
jgi:CRP-like cAMP-binding protein